ncbi:MAG TPA: phosphoserine phosphatase SerB, partial [Burkholderiales bacterium]|nr:phosphoserine phosphatase SerB [Burkholderiales bacterium]
AILMPRRMLALSAMGHDRPGLISDVSGLVTRAGGNIVHVEESALRGMFSMFMLIEVPGTTEALPLFEIRDRLIAALREVDLEITIEVVDEKTVEARKARKLAIVTIMGQDKLGVMHAITKTIAAHGINIERMRHVASGDFMAFEIVIDATGANLSDLRRDLRATCEGIGVDAVVQPDGIFRTRRRMVVFDMDSTIIEGEIINELARAAGVESSVSEITERAMRGEMEFRDALKERVRMLKGLPVSDLTRIAESMKLTPGAEELIFALRRMGFKIALISGGFTFFTDKLKRDLGFDYTFANELVIKDGKLTGAVKGTIIDREKKGAIVKRLAKLEGLRRDEIVAIGDGANDTIMIKNAGLGIAFNAKEVLRKVADGSITRRNLEGLLYALGATDSEIERVKAVRARKPRAKR